MNGETLRDEGQMESLVPRESLLPVTIIVAGFIPLPGLIYMCQLCSSALKNHKSEGHNRHTEPMCLESLA